MERQKSTQIHAYALQSSLYVQQIFEHDLEYQSVLKNGSCSCQSTLQIREQYWSDIVNMDIHLCAELSGLQNEDLFLVLLGRHTNTPTDVHYFRMMNFRFVRNSAAIYNRALQLHALPV